MDEVRRRLAAKKSGLDIHYELGDGHPLLGRRMPDFDLITADGPRRVFSRLHSARPVLPNLGEPGSFNIASWEDRLQLIDAQCDGLWEFPVIGSVAAPAAVLIRPDGYVAWVGGKIKLNWQMHEPYGLDPQFQYREVLSRWSLKFHLQDVGGRSPHPGSE